MPSYEVEVRREVTYTTITIQAGRLAVNADGPDQARDVIERLHAKRPDLMPELDWRVVRAVSREADEGPLRVHDACEMELCRYSGEPRSTCVCMICDYVAAN